MDLITLPANEYLRNRIHSNYLHYNLNLIHRKAYQTLPLCSYFDNGNYNRDQKRYALRKIFIIQYFFISLMFWQQYKRD